MTKFFDPINVSATHIYHSALELSPVSSIVRRLYYHRRHTPFPRVVAGTQDSWDESISLSGMSLCRSYTWSPCGRFVAAAVEGAVGIRDALTFELLATIQPTKPTSQLTGRLAYSPDGRSFACLSDTALIIWDIQTGGVAKEIGRGGATDSASLMWSLDGRTIGTVEDRETDTGYAARVYDIASGTTFSPGILRSSNEPYLWAHDTSFRVMTTERDGQDCTINISEVGTILAQIESFRVDSWGQYDTIRSFSPATYRISVFNLIRDQFRILDVRNSESLLEVQGDHVSSHCFSSDGSLFAIYSPRSVRIWKYSPSRYTPWRQFSHRTGPAPSSPYPLQFSPTLSSILGSFKAVLQVWRLDVPYIATHTDNHTSLAVLSWCGTYVATAHVGNSTITITNLHSRTPPQLIETGMEIDKLAITGNILLVANSDELVAWRLTEEGAVFGIFTDGRADRNDSIWAVPQSPPLGFAMEDQIVIVRRNRSDIHAYHIGTGEVLKPAQASPRTTQYNIQDMQCGQHYLHYRGMDSERGLPSEDDWPVSWTALRKGWVKDPEGRHRLWIPVGWRTNFNAGWFYNITTLWLHRKGERAIIIML